MNMKKLATLVSAVALSATVSANAMAKDTIALVVVTNQSGIARGKFTEAQFETLTEWMDWSLADRDVDLDGIRCV